ncbi:MAG: iron-sulfur cluster assembly scaffold protein [Sphingomonadaceae bacterium]|jgi:NifU-like protein involved in Fe-S cluster formation
MTSHLYSREILRLATSLAGQKRLEHPDATSDRRSPTCGSRVIVDVMLDADARVAEIGMEARACALGQASAALVVAHAAGATAEEVQAARHALRAYLADGSGDTGFWPGIDVFAAARDYPARHPSILLAFEALSEAVEAASGARKGEAA